MKPITMSKRAQSDREWNGEQLETPTPDDYYELQQQMNQLQTELFNERQKSKELAAKVAGYEDTIKGECFRLQAGDVVAISLKREFFEQTETHEFYRQGLLKLMPPGVHAVMMAEGCTLMALGDHQLMQLGLVRATGTVETLAKRIVEMDKLLSSAHSRIAELERDEPIHEDIATLRKALCKAGIAAPESDEELGIRWLSHVRHLIRSVSQWGFVSASERDALAAKLALAEADVLQREAQLLLTAHETPGCQLSERSKATLKNIGGIMLTRAALARAKAQGGE